MSGRADRSVVARTCEAYKRGLAAGENPTDIVGEIAAAEGVQRPAVWRRLISGGLKEPYAERQPNGKGRPIGGGNPGFTVRRIEKSITAAARRRPDPEPDQFVNRDPCPRCGVRADIGCSHSKVRLGTVL
jgi:hypothetical protein